MPNSTSIRPVTSKARGICRYYTTARGCFAGDSCKFLHGQLEGETKEEKQLLLTPYDKSKRCRYFDQGFCKRGENCWFLHKTDRNKDTQAEEEEDVSCSICFENPATYGLLDGCSHIFCITCIRQWRDPQNKAGDVVESGNTKKCPMCRAPSRFITPSSKFWKDGTEEKKGVTRAYMESMARVPCRYFQKSLQKNAERPTCPYGKDCFYQHLKADGTPFFFKDGVDICMRKYGSTRRRDIGFDFLPFDIRAAADGALDLWQTLYGSGSSDSINHRHGITTMGPFPLTPALQLGPTFSIHRQHDRNHNNQDGIAITVRRLREVGRSLEILNDATAEFRANLEGTSEWVVDQGEEEQEDEAMGQLESLADQMLSGAERNNANLEHLPRLFHYFSRSRNATEGDGSEIDDMPELQSVSSTEDEDSDVDIDEGTSTVAASASSDGSEPLFWLASEQQELDDAATSTRMDDQGVDESNPADLEVVDEQVIQQDYLLASVQTATTNPTPPINDIPSPTTMGSKNAKPSDAFTTDGRGRVISVGDTPSAVTPSQPQCTTDDQVELESTTARTDVNTTRTETRGILEWLGSLI